MKLTRRTFGGLAFALGLAVAGFSLPAVAGDTIFQADGKAIRGYDTVAYFTEGKAVMGSADYTAEYKDAIWHFASAENRDLFAANPEDYAPQYEGHCAFGAAQGYAVEVDPTQWSVRDGKLYLNYSAHVQGRWLEDPTGYITKADANWPDIRPGNK